MTFVNSDSLPRARAALGRLVGAGFGETQVARWFGVPLVSDARYVPAPPERSRRGLGGFIALFVAGEEVPIEWLGLGLLAAEELDALVACGLMERRGERVRARVRLLPLRGLVLASDGEVGAEAVGAPDLSALNVAACLPVSLPSRPTLDVGCGAGVLTLLCARAGARAVGSDLDERALEMARLNAALNGLSVELRKADLYGDAAGRFALVTFNAPLLRAPLAADPQAAPRYLTSPEGEALALGFLDGLPAHLLPAGEALLHAQLTPAVETALSSLARRAHVVSLRFATAPDGTPHALTSIRTGGATGRRSLSIPLGPLCPQLRRELLDAYHAPTELVPDATPVAAPWLELRTVRQLGGAYRATTFGQQPVDAEDVALLEQLGSSALADLAIDRPRLADLIARGLVVLR